jgi:4-hydroxythreonine-4-phosphate dehydrogenase
MAAAFAPATAVTMGDPAGIGIEITLKAWSRRQEAGLGPFFLVADVDAVRREAAETGISVPITPLENPGAASAAFANALPVLHRPLTGRIVAGTPDPAHAPAILGAIDTATDLTTEGRANALVTNPIHKETLIQAGFRFSGHTDYLGHLAGGLSSVMMLVSQDLRVVPATVHTGLREAIDSLTSDLLVDCGKTTAQSLREDFGILSPRIVMTGLNPHAGEGGVFGFEEKLIIAPAVERLRAEGITIRGPLAADTLFHPAARATYDAAICMYHDQALIPIKTLDFAHAVNTTLGLPFVRTSPDHGTALDIAGTNCADPSSLIEAIRLAQTMADNRGHPA